MAPRRRAGPLAASRARRGTFGDDERGSFVVLEAILVALLVLTAILFFTSVQRPSTGTDQGGLDLGQVAADTLSILEVRTFTVTNGTSALKDLEDWVTNATRYDTTGNSTSAAVEEFLEEVLPTGSRYAVRLDNGVSNLTLLPAGGAGEPHGARAAQVLLFPSWSAHRNDTATALTPLVTVSPGEVVEPECSDGVDNDGDGATDSPADLGCTGLTDSTESTAPAKYDLVKATAGDTQYLCYRAPTTSKWLVDSDPTNYAWLSSVSNGNNTWASHWRGTPGELTPWKENVGADAQQVPKDLIYGRWRVYTSSTCNGVPSLLVDVVPPGYRTATATLAPLGTTGALTLTVGTGTLTSSDVGKIVTGGTLVPNKARILSVTSDTTATVSVSGTILAPGTTVTISQDPTFLPYSLQLVVWFGA